VSTATAQAITGPMVWTGKDLRRSTDWIRALAPAEIDELDAALRAVQRRGLSWQTMTRDDFPLPRLTAALAEVSRELEDDRGLVLLRRIPVERYSDDELRIVYWGLGLHLGTPRYQNAQGELIGDVRDENRRRSQPPRPRSSRRGCVRGRYPSARSPRGPSSPARARRRTASS
jgi:hypothetical protein